MSGMQSTPIQERFISRQDTEPNNPVDGFLWIDPTGGANGNNRERYVYNGDVDSWELEQAVGPDNPNFSAAGALWRDTGVGKQKVYDGGWQQIGSIGPQWEEDGVFTLNGFATGTYNLASSWDMVKIIIGKVQTDATTVDEIQMRINGDSAANYDLMMSDGTTTVGASQINRLAFLTDGKRGAVGEVHIDGRWADACTAQLDIGTHAGYKCLSAVNTAIVSPMTDFTIFGPNPMELTAHVYGMDV